MYVKCGSLSSAVKVFGEMSEKQSAFAPRDITLWNSMLDGYFRYGRIRDGMFHFRRMQSGGFRPDGYSLSILLRGAREGFYREGRQIHAYIVSSVFDSDPFLITALIDMYSSCGRPLDALQAFYSYGDRSNIVVWNSLIGGLCENGLWEDSLAAFSLAKAEGCTLGSFSFSSALTACAYGGDVDFGKLVHCIVIKGGFEGDPYVCTSLLNMYAKCGQVDLSETVFNDTPNKNIELWNAMISAYVAAGCAYETINAYRHMRLSEFQCDSFTISNILSCCAMAGLCDFGRTVHTELIKRSIQSNTAVQSALLTMYSKCGNIGDASSVFISMKERDVVAWGSMISGFCQNGKSIEALNLFLEATDAGMKPDSDIMASVVSACMGLENIKLGCGVHGYVIKVGLIGDVFVGSSLLDMYSKCGIADMARIVFSEMAYKNLVAWNSIIACYCRNGLPEFSISLFPQVAQHGLYPDSYTITTVLVAISITAALSKGKIVHGYHIRLQVPFPDLQVENALIDMYIKCGSLKYAQNIFFDMSERNLLTWNTMISGYGSHGECQKAIGLYDHMGQSGVKPDDVTFLCLISSCSHAGMIEEGLNLFRSMKEVHGIKPRMEHYVNAVDILGRAGRLDDAYGFINNMAIEPDSRVWLCLLGACRVHRAMELGELAANNLLRVEPCIGSNYVHLSNLYGEAGSWDKAATLRVSMKEKGLKKNPGCSWVEVGNSVVTFFSGDSSSPRISEIYMTLNDLQRNMKAIE